MKNYNHGTNKRMTAHYVNEITLWNNTRVTQNAEEIFWFWIAELLLTCFDLVGDMGLSILSDCMDVISRKITDNPPCWGIERAVKERTPEYKEYQDMYGVTEFYEDCGKFYKELNDENNELLKEQIVMIMTDYIKYIAPFVFREAKKWMAEYVDEEITDEGWLVFEFRYGNYLQRYKDQIKMLKK